MYLLINNLYSTSNVFSIIQYTKLEAVPARNNLQPKYRHLEDKINKKIQKMIIYFCSPIEW